MKLSSVSIKNYHCFTDETIYFDPNLTVLIGDNGCGKTSVLEAVKIALGSFFLGIDGITTTTIDKNDVRKVLYTSGSTVNAEPQFPIEISAAADFPPCSSTVTGLNSACRIEWKRSLSGTNNKTTVSEAKDIKQYSEMIQAAVREGKQDIELPIISYYSTGRLWAQKKDTKDNIFNSDEPLSRFEGYKDCLSAVSNEKRMKKWFQTITFTELQDRTPSPELSAVKKAISVCFRNIIPDCKPETVTVRYEVKSRELQILYLDKEDNMMVHPMHELSDGYRNTLGMIADIAYRMAVLNPQMLDKCTEAHGVVLIDEIDLHLHPMWQKRIIADLREAFPNVQFIVTTHSPQVISSVSTNNIVRLRNYSAENVIEETYGKDTNLVLNTFMGVSERPEPIMDEINKIRDMLDNGQFSEAKPLIDSLAKKLGADDPIITEFNTIVFVEGGI